MALLLAIDEKSVVPLYRQITDSLKEKIDGGDIPEGFRLPSSRKLAARLGINRSTVYKAYQELWALGYIESAPGSYSVVRRRRIPTFSPDAEQFHSRINWDRHSSQAAGTLRAAYDAEGNRSRELAELLPAGEKPIDFTPLAPDPRHLPAEAFRKCLNTVLTNGGPELLSYGDPQGSPALREYIAQRLRLHAIHVSPEEIILTAGAQNGIDLLLQCFAPPGAAVAFESPSYSRAISLARLRGARLLPVPMTPYGMNLEELQRVIAGRHPAMIYTIPNFHNPTGITTAQAHREELLQICEEAGLPLVEDGFEEELKYFGTNILPIKSMDRSGTVLYLGTFSKVLFPGLRIGWIAADRRAVEYITAAQKHSILCGSRANQEALALFCRRGFYDAHLRRMHRLYRSRMQTALQALERHVSQAAARWNRPLGGYTLWLELQHTRFRSEHELQAGLARRGVLVSPGGDHYLGPKEGLRFRLSIGMLEEEKIEEGIRRIGEILADAAR